MKNQKDNIKLIQIRQIRITWKDGTTGKITLDEIREYGNPLPPCNATVCFTNGQWFRFDQVNEECWKSCELINDEHTTIRIGEIQQYEGGFHEALNKLLVQVNLR
ncbi:hypothetical protein ES705_24899 [subsurface metagenome]